ncbi:MAG TPA: hypothetical protein VG889_04175 [Rhizomicrobium sp.]|nr:hypothetical protein [Rhizomicrobium sp.]
MGNVFATWWAIIREGLHHINPIQGLILGVLFGFTASSLIGIVFGAFAASAVYVAIDALKPVVLDHKTFHLPVLDTPFWHFFLALYFAFFVLIALIVVVRQLIDSMRG